MGQNSNTAASDYRIYTIRGQSVMLDEDLARIFGVETKRLNQQAGRNRGRFPGDFMFQLTKTEAESLRLHFATLEAGRGKYRKYLPYAFTEHGAVMLAAVLNSPQAVRASVAIARAFVRLRRESFGRREVSVRLKDLEKRVSAHDSEIGELFDEIREMVDEPQTDVRKIGFLSGE